MAKKQVWVTWLAAESPALSLNAVGQALAKNGLSAGGAPWENNLQQMTWLSVADVVTDTTNKADAWVIVGDRESFHNKDTRFGLSLITMLAKETRGYDFPIFVLAADFNNDAELPFLLRDATIVSSSEAAWAAKIVAQLHLKRSVEAPSYRFSVRANPAFGLWLEIGPREGEWQGVMAGVSDSAEITHQAVGERGVVPERCTLEYPIQGMKGEIGDHAYQLWATKNRLSSNESYYIRITGTPERVVFGNYPDEDAEGDVTVIELC